MLKVKIAEIQMEKEQAFDIRRKVFVDEQHVPIHIEMDEYDDTAVHFVGYQLEQPIAAGRIREVEAGLGKVERVCVLSEYRGQHIGVMMMNEMEEYARTNGIFRLKLNAQTHALAFYEKLGYDITSDEFMDAGIPHKSMEKVVS
ncbi:putative GNAT family N-acyltransferase [Planomicrobium stackebrandtii]|uniref:GNAT family N-acyltransferase n=1 Tax=Planomicrobium stackebrandtii TaxID=253160 RepID=A0ABU0GX24_9BACL|nr:GNAT family N-acetyltransferase [Planomicrobium stackebrandtii]MDQ0429082.1 putative GNAT family N-acyltransferase [Planomicrobium stackebrandtii]